MIGIKNDYQTLHTDQSTMNEMFSKGRKCKKFKQNYSVTITMTKIKCNIYLCLIII